MRKIAILLLAVLLAACSGTQTNTETDAAGSAAASPAASRAASPAASASTSEALASPSVAARPSRAPTAAPVTPGPDEFVNPVIDRDFPDPDVLRVGDSYYAYATNSGSTNIQTVRSEDLVEWESLPDALPTLPPWAKPGFTWAPEVTTAADGTTFVMYMTARDTASNKQCIGVATSDKPEGPFQSASDTPLICQLDEGGSIDASAFVDDDGSRYLLWKNDGNCCGFTTYLYLQRVSADGLALEGEPTRLINNDQAWEGNLVEAPTLWKHEARYFLFYSANNYAGLNYATGVASADTITGPYTKAPQPLLSSDLKNGAAFGPGGQDIVLDKEQEPWLLYHSWDTSITYRGMQIDELRWENGMPVVQGPDRGPQPRP